MSLPYENTTSGLKARDDIQKLLVRFGCSRIGFMDDFEKKELLLQFTWNERNVSLRANWQGYANAWTKEHPWSYRRRGTKQDWEARALAIGQVAVNSILRDWVKGQVTAIETGILSFEHVFMPYMLLSDGRSVLEHIKAQELLPAPSP